MVDGDVRLCLLLFVLWCCVVWEKKGGVCDLERKVAKFELWSL